MRLLLLFTAFALAAGCTEHRGHPPPSEPAPASPYAGQEARALKALSEEEIAAYRSGAGMALARVAELNHYPGPRHVLDLAAGLGLTDAQRAAVEEQFGAMQSEAVRLGAEILAREADLEAMFAGGTAVPDRATALMEEIGHLNGRLRAVHVRAHIATRALLTDDQTAAYDRLRGYAHGEGHGAHDPAMHGH